VHGPAREHRHSGGRETGAGPKLSRLYMMKNCFSNQTTQLSSTFASSGTDICFKNQSEILRLLHLQPQRQM
jgi:hypothetical protein